MVDAPLDISTGKPVGRQRHWDGGHDSYYENLVKMTLLAPKTDPYIDTYKKRFTDAAYSLRSELATRSAVASDHATQHLFIGRQDDKWYLNRQGHLACFAPGTILLGANSLRRTLLANVRTRALRRLPSYVHSDTLQNRARVMVLDPQIRFQRPNVPTAKLCAKRKNGSARASGPRTHATKAAPNTWNRSSTHGVLLDNSATEIGPGTLFSP